MLTVLRERLKAAGSAVCTVKVRAGAPSTQIKGMLANGVIKIDVAAVREDGKANAELIRFLAEEFDVSRSNVEIVAGKTAALKRVKLTKGMQ